MTLKDFKEHFQESFIKPIAITGMPGVKAKELSDLDDLLIPDDTEMLVVELVSFLSEWKVSVHNGVVDTIFHNKGAWDEFPNSGIIELIADNRVKAGMKNFIIHVGVMPFYYKRRDGRMNERNITVLVNLHGRNEHKGSDSSPRK